MRSYTCHVYIIVSLVNQNTFIGTTFQWLGDMLHAACDTSAGEVYSQTSSKNTPSLQQCKKLCEASTECRSITYFKSGWCSHYSTPCAHIKRHNDAIASQVRRYPVVTPVVNAPTTATSGVTGDVVAGVHVDKLTRHTEKKMHFLINVHVQRI